MKQIKVRVTWYQVTEQLLPTRCREMALPNSVHNLLGLLMCTEIIITRGRMLLEAMRGSRVQDLIFWLGGWEGKRH